MIMGIVNNYDDDMASFFAKGKFLWNCCKVQAYVTWVGSIPYGELGDPIKASQLGIDHGLIKT